MAGVRFSLIFDHFGALAGGNLVRPYKALLGSVAVALALAVLILFRSLKIFKHIQKVALPDRLPKAL